MVEVAIVEGIVVEVEVVFVVADGRVFDVVVLVVLDNELEAVVDVERLTGNVEVVDEVFERLIAVDVEVDVVIVGDVTVELACGAEDEDVTVLVLVTLVPGLLLVVVAIVTGRVLVLVAEPESGDEDIRGVDSVDDEVLVDDVVV